MGAVSLHTGFVLDVDGPISSPSSRTLRAPGLADALVTLVNAGCVVALNTGRSEAFLRDRIVPVLREHGLRRDAPLWGIGEKGGVWSHLASGGETHSDERLALDSALLAAIERMAVTEFSDIVFWDDTKLTMASLEQRLDCSDEVYRARRHELDLRLAEVIRGCGYALAWEGREDLSDQGATVRLDPTIIASDVEHVGTGKDTGARLLVELLRNHGVPVPTSWLTMGDSRTDYAMAWWLHDNGWPVKHVDVRPADGVPHCPFPVLTHPEFIHDDAGAWFAQQWAQALNN